MTQIGTNGIAIARKPPEAGSIVRATRMTTRIGVVSEAIMGARKMPLYAATRSTPSVAELTTRPARSLVRCEGPRAKTWRIIEWRSAGSIWFICAAPRALTAHANTPDPRAPSTPIHQVDQALLPAMSSMPQPIAR